jgi:hypothetical protein
MLDKSLHVDLLSDSCGTEESLELLLDLWIGPHIEKSADVLDELKIGLENTSNDGMSVEVLDESGPYLEVVSDNGKSAEVVEDSKLCMELTSSEGGKSA